MTFERGEEHALLAPGGEFSAPDLRPLRIKVSRDVAGENEGGAAVLDAGRRIGILLGADDDGVAGDVHGHSKLAILQVVAPQLGGLRPLPRLLVADEHECGARQLIVDAGPRRADHDSVSIDGHARAKIFVSIMCIAGVVERLQIVRKPSPRRRGVPGDVARKHRRFRTKRR